MTVDTESVIFPEHFGFCEGVKAADDLLRDVTTMAHEFGIKTVFGYHGIVHNAGVIRDHERNGVHFTEGLDDILDNSIVVKSAHGVGPEIQFALEKKGCTIFEAACPLVLQTHRAVERARIGNEKVIYVCKGKPGTGEKLHDEVVGIVGCLDYTIKDGDLVRDPLERTYLGLDESLTDDILSKNGGKYEIVTQTTLNAGDSLRYRQEIVDYITERQPDAKIGLSRVGHVCHAVTKRQEGVADLVDMKPDRIVVATDPSSKNGMGYYALAKSLINDSGQPTEVYAVATVEEAVQLGKIDGLTGLTASASTPDSTTFGVAQALGINQLPDVNRRAFSLPDASAKSMFDKIEKHVKRLEKLGAK